MCCRWVGACWVRQGARYVLLCARGHTAAGAANKGRETRGGQLGGRVYMFSSGCGCWLGKWHWGASHSDGGGLWLCTCLGATQTLSHPTASLPCFTVLQCVLLLWLAHLPRHSPPLWSAAGSLADLTLSLLLSPSLSSFGDPNFSSSLSCWAATSTSHTHLGWCRGFWLLKSWQGWIALQFPFHHPPPCIGQKPFFFFFCKSQGGTSWERGYITCRPRVPRAGLANEKGVEGYNSQKN